MIEPEEDSTIDVDSGFIKKKKFVIVFDLDGVICKPPMSGFPSGLCSLMTQSAEIDQFPQLHPECPLPILFKSRVEEYYHFFPPYLDVLIKYLIENGSRIVFFSAGNEDRNKFLVDALLSTILGRQYYQQLKEKGQFSVFSSNNLRRSYHLHETGVGMIHGHYVKDLAQVLQDDEVIENSILVEDQPAYAAFNSKPCIMSLILYQWDILSFNDSELSFPKNNVYYLLGIFISYFDSDKSLSLSLREGIEKIYQEKVSPDHLKNGNAPLEKFHPFVLEMISLGLLEVQKQRPDAVFYGTKCIEGKVMSKYHKMAPKPLVI